MILVDISTLGEEPLLVLKLLTLNLTAVGGSAHTSFKDLKLKKSLSAKNRQKIPIPQKTSAESKSWIMYPSKNFNLCLFYASEQTKVQKRLLKVYTISHGRHIFAHIQVGGLGGSGGGGKAANQQKSAW
jgi:hypothetical protein